MSNRTLAILASAIGLSAVFAVGWFLFGDAIQEHLRRQPFDPKLWQSQKGFNDVRIRMVDDLLRRHSFRGMPREQLIPIVGEPDETGYFREWDLVYWLGPERGFMGIDSEWLVFRLDSKQRVTEFRIISD